MAGRFAGKSVLVIGGTTGIGLAAVRGFVREGAKVALTGRNTDALKSIASELGVFTVRGDVADLKEAKSAVEQAAKAVGKFDAVFMNAGISTVAPAATITPEEWDQCFAVNLRGAVFALQYALPHMKDGGAIVVSGSVGSELSVPGTIAYASAKAGLRAAMRVLAGELIPRRIRVNVIGIGATNTDIYKRGVSAENLPAVEAAVAASNPMNRMAKPEETAGVVLFLASDEAAFMTGANVHFDGGHVDVGSGGAGRPELSEIWQ
jgi:NAD(P)-dependent dehydrogenase (short-subunit alcohol dehydrogenase family)